MSDRDIEQIADAYLVDPDDRPLDDDRYAPLAADTADGHENAFDIEFIADAIADAFADPCEACGDTRYVNIPAGYIGGVPAYRQEPCRECNGGAA